MKTTIKIEIETPNDCEVYPEEKLTSDDFEEYKQTLEAEQDRLEFSKDLHTSVVTTIMKQFEKRPFYGNPKILNESPIEEQILDELEECYIEGWESLEDYGIKLKVTKEEFQKGG